MKHREVADGRRPLFGRRAAQCSKRVGAFLVCPGTHEKLRLVLVPALLSRLRRPGSTREPSDCPSEHAMRAFCAPQRLNTQGQISAEAASGRFDSTGAAGGLATHPPHENVRVRLVPENPRPGGTGRGKAATAGKLDCIAVQPNLGRDRAHSRLKCQAEPR